MSMIDIFYPGNPERKQRLICKSQEIQEMMKNNFRATNQLMDVLKKHKGLSFSLITVNEKATVQENCEVIIERIHEIQAEVEKVDQELKEKLEPTLYEKLKNVSLSAPQHSLRIPFFLFGLIVDPIIGAIERDQLEYALKEYEKALVEFRPESEKYQDNLTYVRIRMEN